MDNERGRLVFTVGVARCGKSTYCNRWRNYEEEQGVLPKRPRAIVCGDDIRIAVHGQRFNRHAEPLVWAIHTYMVKSLLLRGHDVIVDGTNTTEDSIWRLLNIDDDASCVVVPSDPELCKRRALACGHDDLVTRGVIDRQYEQLCELQEQEGGVQGVVARVRQRVKLRWPSS